MIEHRHTGIDSPKVNAKNIAGLELDNTVMHTVNNESIEDIKTFTSIPVLSDNDATTDNQVVRKSQIDDNAPSVQTIPSVILTDSADTERAISSSQTTYTKDKDVTINSFNGYITVKFDLKDDDGSGQTFGSIYKNGAQVGIERIEGSGIWTTYEEVIEVNTDDEVQLYTKYDSSSGGIGGAIRNFRLYYSKSLTPTLGTINLD